MLVYRPVCLEERVMKDQDLWDRKNMSWRHAMLEDWKPIADLMEGGEILHERRERTAKNILAYLKQRLTVL